MMDVDGEKADGTARYLGATYKVCSAIDIEAPQGGLLHV